MGGQVGEGNSIVHGIARATGSVGNVFVAPLERPGGAAGTEPGSIAAGEVGADGRVGRQRQ